MVYHILNGDALKEQISSVLDGELIICRELMMEGPCQGADLDSILKTRQDFFSKELGITETEYTAKSISELKKLQQLKNRDEINLWFEDDLFCQSNLWFCVFVISQLGFLVELFYIRPKEATTFGFGGLNTKELLIALENKNTLTQEDIDLIIKVWKAFQVSDFQSLKQMSINFKTKMPWISEAIDAHLARFIFEGSFGLHEELMLQSIKETDQPDFKSTFKLFSSKASVYGYGDLQAKKIYDKMINHV